MSYFTQAKLAADQGLLLRVTACAALEQLEDAANWAARRMWSLSSQPGWDATYAAALSVGKPKPGEDETVITDAMILAAVQALRPPPTTTDSLTSPAE